MSSNSAIEWTDATWNPVRGCTKISPGCKHCYAETFAERFRGVKNHPYEQGFDLRLVPEKLGEPLRWRTPKMIFVNSMSDLFHDAVPDDYICAVARVMTAAQWHTYQVLTKRSERLQRLLRTTLQICRRAIPYLVGSECRRSKARTSAYRRLTESRCCREISVRRTVAGGRGQVELERTRVGDCWWRERPGSKTDET
jgi:protein gp37